MPSSNESALRKKLALGTENLVFVKTCVALGGILFACLRLTRPWWRDLAHGGPQNLKLVFGPPLVAWPGPWWPLET